MIQTSVLYGKCMLGRLVDVIRNGLPHCRKAGCMGNLCWLSLEDSWEVRVWSILIEVARLNTAQLGECNSVRCNWLEVGELWGFWGCQGFIC